MNILFLSHAFVYGLKLNVPSKLFTNVYLSPTTNRTNTPTQDSLINYFCYIYGLILHQQLNAIALKNICKN